MPLGVKLECSRRLNHGDVVARASHELQSNWKITFGEAAGNRQCWKSAEIADGAEWIRESEIGFQIGIQRRGGDGLSGCDQHVKRVEQSFHLSSGEFSRMLSARR